MVKGQTQTNYQIITNHTLEILKAKISMFSLNQAVGVNLVKTIMSKMAVVMMMIIETMSIMTTHLKIIIVDWEDFLHGSSLLFGWARRW